MTSIFTHNSAIGRVQVTHAWTTDVIRSLTGNEQRRSRGSRPSRQVVWSTFTAEDYDVPFYLEDMIARVTSEMYVPLFSDSLLVTEESEYFASSISATSTSMKRFYPGQKILVVNPQTVNRSSEIIIATVDSVALNTITIQGSLGFSRAEKGAFVYPAIAIDPMLEDLATLRSGEVIDATHTAFERIDEGLPAEQEFGDNTGFDTHLGFPVFPFTRWSDGSIGYRVEAEDSTSGLERTILQFGQDRLQASLTFQFTTREDVFKMLKFFDSRAGRTLPFWFVSPISEIPKPASFSGGILTSPNTKGYSGDNLDEGDFLAFVPKSGPVVIRKILQKNVGPGDSGYAYEGSDPFPEEDLLYVAQAVLARFNSDSLTEEWESETVATMRASFLQVPFDGTDEAGNDDGEDIDPPVDDPDDDGWIPVPNPCPSAESSGVTVPMYDVPCYANGGTRPLVRCSDLVLPKFIPVDISNISNNGSFNDQRDLSADLEDILLNDGLYHVLEYVGTWQGSCTWPQLQGVRIPSSSFLFFDGSAPSVTHHIWQLQIPYGDHTLDLRFIMSLHQNSSQSPGFFGPLMGLFIFTDELNPSYADGQPWNPAGYGSANIIWDRNSPLFHGTYSAGVADRTKVFGHPHLLAYGLVPTTWESPCGTDPYPHIWENRRTCFEKPTGAPWESGSATNAARNNVFTRDRNQDEHFATTVGGGWLTGSTLWESLASMNVSGLSRWNADLDLKFCDPGQEKLHPCLSPDGVSSLQCINRGNPRDCSFGLFQIYHSPFSNIQFRFGQSEYRMERHWGDFGNACIATGAIPLKKISIKSESVTLAPIESSLPQESTSGELWGISYALAKGSAGIFKENASDSVSLSAGSGNGTSGIAREVISRSQGGWCNLSATATFPAGTSCYLAIRANSGGDGVAVVYDHVAQTVRLVSMSGHSIGTVRDSVSASLSGPIALSISVDGTDFSGSANGVGVSIDACLEDCTNPQGRVILGVTRAGGGTVSYSISDRADYDSSEASGSINQSGYSASMAYERTPQYLYYGQHGGDAKWMCKGSPAPDYYDDICDEDEFDFSGQGYPAGDNYSDCVNSQVATGAVDSCDKWTLVREAFDPVLGGSGDISGSWDFATVFDYAIFLDNTLPAGYSDPAAIEARTPAGAFTDSSFCGSYVERSLSLGIAYATAICGKDFSDRTGPIFTSAEFWRSDNAAPPCGWTAPGTFCNSIREL